MESASPKTPKTTTWTYLRGFYEKNWTPGLFSWIWPLWHDLERPLWVRMTSYWIFKSRNGISIPKTPQNDYLNISEMFSKGIIGKLVQKLFQKMAKMRKSKNRNLKKTVHQNENWHLIPLLGTLHEFKSAAIPLVTFLRFFFVDQCNHTNYIKVYDMTYDRTLWSSKYIFISKSV